MKRMFYIALAFSLSACASQTEVVFGELAAPKSVAECHRFTFESLVVVSKAQWMKLSEPQKQWVMRHELGHCNEGLDHDERLDQRGCPVSYMYPVVPEERCL